MRKLVFLWGVTLLFAGSVQAQKLTISVMDLNVTSGLAPNEVGMLTDKLLNEFVTYGFYKVVERSKRDEILKEQGFQQSGACDQGACLVEAGQLLGVQKMVGGTIGKLGAVYAVELRIMDVKTGEIDKAFSRQYTGDVSNLLNAMREAATVFSGGGAGAPPAQSAAQSRESGLTFLAINSQGFREYRNEKDGSTLIEVPAGEFTMGSNRGDKNERPVHAVTLDRYYIGKYEITVGQFVAFSNATGYSIRGLFRKQPDINQTNYPIKQLQWIDAKAYCDWAGLRLPSEAEWEKAARGTDSREYPWGNEWDPLKCNGGGSSDGYGGTAPVGSFAAGISPYGCYDMAGNVWEWCNDWYDEDYYARSQPNNPPGPAAGKHHAMRGGGWDRSPEGICRSARRYRPTPAGWYGALGIRPAK